MQVAKRSIVFTVSFYLISFITRLWHLLRFLRNNSHSRCSLDYMQYLKNGMITLSIPMLSKLVNPNYNGVCLESGKIKSVDFMSGGTARSKSSVGK